MVRGIHVNSITMFMFYLLKLKRAICYIIPSLCMLMPTSIRLIVSISFFREISFTLDYDKGIEQRAWDGLLDHRILIYCT